MKGMIAGKERGMAGWRDGGMVGRREGERRIGGTESEVKVEGGGWGRGNIRDSHVRS